MYYYTYAYTEIILHIINKHTYGIYIFICIDTKNPLNDEDPENYKRVKVIQEIQVMDTHMCIHINICTYNIYIYMYISSIRSWYSANIMYCRCSVYVSYTHNIGNVLLYVVIICATLETVGGMFGDCGSDRH